jgi:hypothetical protein
MFDPMKLARRISAVSLTLALTPAGQAVAHHSFAMFNGKETVTMVGVVRSFEMVNPHSWLQLAVTDERGRAVEWAFEMGDPAQLSREGWTKTSVQPGDHVTVQIHPRLDGSHGGQLMSIVLPDGKELDADKPAARLVPP